MSSTEMPFCRLIVRGNADPFAESTETYDDSRGISDRLRELWNQHRSRFSIGMGVTLRNRWNDRLDVIITERGWMLLCQMKGESLTIVPGDKHQEGFVAFMEPSQLEWTELSAEYLIDPEVAERMVLLWICIREVPRRWKK